MALDAPNPSSESEPLASVWASRLPDPGARLGSAGEGPVPPAEPVDTGERERALGRSSALSTGRAS